MTPPLPLVSFVVPVRNDARRLGRCLASIRAADYPADLVEIIVADNGSTDGSDRVARDAGAQVLSLPRIRVAEMRNLAVQATHGRVIAFVDADHEIDAAWIRSAVETLQRPDVGAAGAPYEAPHAGTWVQEQYDRLRRRREGLSEVEWLGSGNLAVWRHLFDGAGGFDTSLHTCEDVALCQRLQTQGSRIMSDSRMRSIHFGDPATLPALFAGELWRGRDNLRVSLRPPRSLRHLASLAVPMLELGLIVLGLVGLLVGIFVAGSRGPLTLLVAVAGVAALTSLQCWRMLRSRPVSGATDVVQTFAVASVYGLARALALVVRVPHSLRRRGTS